MSQTIVLPDLSATPVKSAGYKVTMFNNETNSFDEVITILMIATDCSVDEAEIEAWEAHTYGQAHVHFSSKENCDEVAQIISSIGVATEVTLEWPE